MNKREEIKGWGIDAQKIEPEEQFTHWDRPVLQTPQVEVQHSNERPSLSAVFGTTVPPTGISGILRRYAFLHSESRYRHWIPLLVADRINAIEGVVADIKQGKDPGIFKGKRLKAFLKNNPKSILLAAAAVVVLGTVFRRGAKGR